MQPSSVAYGPVAYRPSGATRANPFTRRPAPRAYRPSGATTTATVQGLVVYTPQAKTLRPVAQWGEDGGTFLEPGTGVSILARTPYWIGSPPGSGREGEALWKVRTAQGVDGWLRLTHDEAEGGLMTAYLAAFPDEEPSTRELLSALPEVRPGLIGGPPEGQEGGGWSGYALAGLAGILFAAGLYYLSPED